MTQRNGRHVLPLANFRRNLGLFMDDLNLENIVLEPLSVIPIANGLKEASSVWSRNHHICRDLSHGIFRAESDILGLFKQGGKSGCVRGHI